MLYTHLYIWNLHEYSTRVQSFSENNVYIVWKLVLIIFFYLSRLEEKIKIKEEEEEEGKEEEEEEEEGKEDEDEGKEE